MDFLPPKSTHTDISAEICRSLHFDMQILIDFADNFYCVADGKMRVLGILVAFLSSLLSAALTRFRITSTWPPASIMAVSPRSWTTLPSMRTMRCWKFDRCGARMRGVCGWSIFVGVGCEEIAG
jgi:hypothetical protein